MSFLAKMLIGSTEYNVLNLDYDISQRVDQQNRPNAGPKGGIINLVIESNSKNEIIEWAVSPSMVKNGSITFYRRDANSSMKTVAFKDAFCINYKEVFNAEDNSPLKTELTLSARELTINSNFTLTNPWPGSSSGGSDSGSKSSSSSSSGNENIGSFNPSA